MAGRATDPPQELAQRGERNRRVGEAADRSAPRLHGVERIAALADACRIDRRQRDALALHRGLDGRRRRKLALEAIGAADRRGVAIVAARLVRQEIVKFPAAPGLAFIRLGEVEEARPPQRLGEAARRRRPRLGQKPGQGGKAARAQQDARAAQGPSRGRSLPRPRHRPAEDRRNGRGGDLLSGENRSAAASGSPGPRRAPARLHRRRCSRPAGARA